MSGLTAICCALAAMIASLTGADPDLVIFFVCMGIIQLGLGQL